MVLLADALVNRYTNKLADLIEDRTMRAFSVHNDLAILKNRLEYISCVLEDAEAKSLQNKAINSWLKQLKDVMYDADDLIDLCSIECQRSHQDGNSFVLTRQVCCRFPFFSCFGGFLSNCEIGHRIKSINERLEIISRDKIMFTLEKVSLEHVQAANVDIRQTYPLVEVDVVGRGIHKSITEMIQLIQTTTNKQQQSLLSQTSWGRQMIQLIDSQNSEQKLCLMGIVGMGGIGKTTLAQKIYNDVRINEIFQIKLWICVTESFCEIDLLKQIIRTGGGNTDQLNTKAELVPYLMNCLSGRSVFLVLDDVWKSDVWTNLLQLPFQMRSDSSQILVTTRDEKVLQDMRAVHTHHVQKMTDEDSLELLCKKTFGKDEQVHEFIEIGEQIAKKCDGLPLAIKVIAGVLSSKRTRIEWERIRDSEWSVDGLPTELGGSLYLSYKDLHSELKQCFLCCALFPEDADIFRDTAAYWWAAEGFLSQEGSMSMHDTAEDYYMELIRRNLLQPKPDIFDKGIATMHDLLRSLAQHLTKDEAFFLDAEGNSDSDIPKVRRLGIANAREKLPAALKGHDSLRTLVLFNSPNICAIENDVFASLKGLRVLVLRETSINRIPDSVKNLVHLRLLNLSFTKIRELPNSIGNLVNLQYLSLKGCREFCSLPGSITRLTNLRFLRLDWTALMHMPQGMGRLQNLNILKGIFESDSGFKLAELQPLSKLRRLWIHKLERATEANAVIMDKRNLIEIGLVCTFANNTSDQSQYPRIQVQRVQQVFEKLIPPPTLRHLFMIGFPGVEYPKWLEARPHDNLPDLAHIHLIDCISCLKVPPIGQLSAVRVFELRGARAVVNIGAELLGQGVWTAAGTTVFPKLELLRIIDLPNLESWCLSTEELENEVPDNNRQLFLMPCLKRLLLVNCPQLRALPENLKRVANLRRVHIEGAHQLQVIADLPALVWLKVKKNNNLRRISRLCRLECLFAQDCPALEQADNLCSLERLYLVDCLMEQQIRRCFSEQPDMLMIHVASTGGDGRDVFADESLYN